MLIVFAGLPGSGKTTISRWVASRLAAMYLRIDAIEQAIRAAGVLSADVGPAGYTVAQAIAEANLADGRIVVADCVNPVDASRAGWHAVASRCQSRMIDIEIVCSDRTEHRRRVESRIADIPGHRLPSWDEIACLHYEPWDEQHVIIDTAKLSPAEAGDAVMRALA